MSSQHSQRDPEARDSPLITRLMTEPRGRWASLSADLNKRAAGNHPGARIMGDSSPPLPTSLWGHQKLCPPNPPSAPSILAGHPTAHLPQACSSQSPVPVNPRGRGSASVSGTVPQRPVPARFGFSSIKWTTVNSLLAGRFHSSTVLLSTHCVPRAPQEHQGAHMEDDVQKAG